MSVILSPITYLYFKKLELIKENGDIYLYLLDILKSWNYHFISYQGEKVAEWVKTKGL